MVKKYWLAFLAVTLVSCGKDIPPTKVYEEFSSAVKNANSIQEIPFAGYVSKRAFDKQSRAFKKLNIELTDFDVSVNGKPADVEVTKVTDHTKDMKQDKLHAMILGMWKDTTEIPPEYTETMRDTESGKVWELVAQKYPDPDHTLTMTVVFVNENGWKIDNIKQVSADNSGSLSAELMSYR